MVFQAFNLLPRMTLEENVELPMRLAEVSRPERAARVREALERVHLEKRLTLRPGELAGREHQCDVLARALVNRPQILLADEPTGNLDSRTSVEIMQIFQRLNEERNITILLVTHETDIARFAKRVVLFRDGRVRKDTPLEDRADASEVLLTMPWIGDEDEEEEGKGSGD